MLKIRNMKAIFLRHAAILLAMCSLLSWSCQNKNEAEANLFESLQGTKWKLEGVVDARSGVLRKVEDFEHYSPPQPQDYMIEFYDSPQLMDSCNCDDEMSGAFGTCCHIMCIWGCFKFVFETQSVQLVPRGDNRVLSTSELSILYFNAISNSLQTREPLFIIKNNKLRLYFNDKNNYLLFKQIQP